MISTASTYCQFSSDSVKSFDPRYFRISKALFLKAWSRFKWYLNGVKARLDPPMVAPSQMLSYVGVYETNDILFEDKVLYFSRGGRAKQRMTPVGNGSFLIDNDDDRRARFVKDGNVRSLQTCYVSGTIAKFCRSSTG